ncbi:MAG: flagellar hook-length control protein FliK [Lachnospiraceae bacterium]|nr:flagellar hook-length control protein FliK [Lachnospiraceae bacterium]
MQIGQRLITGYDTRLQNAGQIEQTNQAESVRSSADISGLKEGAVFRGEILDIVGEKVTISLENEAKLMARLQSGVELGVGDQLLFSVKENTDSQILIKPMFDSLYSAQTQVLEKALDAAGLSPTEKNFTVAKELMDAGLPVDKTNMVKILSQSMKFEGTSLQTLVSLHKMDISITQENITQYERYQGMQHQLTGDIADAAKGIADFVKAFPSDIDGQTLIQTAKEIVDLFTENNNVSMVEHADSELVNNAQTEEVTANAMNGKEVPDTVAGTQKEDVLLSGNTTVADSQTVGQEENIRSQGAVLQQSIDTYTKETDTGLTGKVVSQLVDNMRQAGISEVNITSVFQKSDSDSALLQNTLQAMQNASVSDEAVRQFLQQDGFRNVLSEVVKRAFSLNPKQMKEPKEIDELYESILKHTKSFEDAVASNGGNPKEFQQNFQNMRQNLQFMNELNQQMIYAQMPVKLSNKQANSELFVYADKRKLQQKKDGISVMLHLDMDHLGATDVKVTLTGSNVHARFYLNDQDSVDIVTENMNQLAKQLADRGFSLTNEVVKRQPQESINKVVDEIIDENAERSIKRYTFDART